MQGTLGEERIPRGLPEDCWGVSERYSAPECPSRRGNYGGRIDGFSGGNKSVSGLLGGELIRQERGL